MKRKFIRAASSSLLGLSLVTGLASAQTGSISNTGASSVNRIRANTSVHESVRNTNKVNAHNDNSQHARTGSARSFQNTTGGDAMSGNATNRSMVSVDAAVLNGGGGSHAAAAAQVPDLDGSIDTTGFNSVNTVTADNRITSRVSNYNNVNVSNDNRQSARSGSASSFQNATGGDAISGNASNSSSSSFVLTVSN